MAHSASIILAFLVNYCGIYVFRNMTKVTLATFPSIRAKYIFDVASYFLLIDMKLYPKSYRRAHWLARTFVETVIGKYLFETWLCDFWFPLENFLHCLINKGTLIIKRCTPRGSVLCTIVCRINEVLTNKNTPEAASILFALCFTLIIMHGTRTVDINILKKCGLFAFIKHLKNRFISGIKRIIRSFSGSGKSCRRRARNDTTYDCYKSTNSSNKSISPGRASILSNNSSYHFERNACM